MVPEELATVMRDIAERHRGCDCTSAVEASNTVAGYFSAPIICPDIRGVRCPSLDSQTIGNQRPSCDVIADHAPLGSPCPILKREDAK